METGIERHLLLHRDDVDEILVGATFTASGVSCIGETFFNFFMTST
jgi:hypothetical protein